MSPPTAAVLRAKLRDLNAVFPSYERDLARQLAADTTIVGQSRRSFEKRVLADWARLRPEQRSALPKSPKQ